MEPTDEIFAARRRTMWEIWTGIFALLTLALFFIQFVWGFRWPPTIDILAYHPTQHDQPAPPQRSRYFGWWDSSQHAPDASPGAAAPATHPGS